MKKTITTIGLITLSLLLVGWSFGDKKPNKSELESSFKMELPSYLQLSDFDVEILENMGNKVDPRWGSRFKAIVKTKVPLYIFDQEDTKKRITFVLLKNKQGAKAEVYGKIITTRYQGKWKHQFDIEGRPIRNLGSQINEFSGRVLIRGSNKEKEYVAKVEQQQEELRDNIANASNILIGTWRDNNSIGIFKKDGTYEVKFDDGKVGLYTWSISGDTMIQKCIKIKRKNRNWEPYNYNYINKILYIDQNSYKFKQGRHTWLGKRIKSRKISASNQQSQNTTKTPPKLSHQNKVDGVWVIYWDNNTLNSLDLKIINQDTVTGFYTNDSHDQCPVNGKFNNDSSIKMEIHCPKWSNKVTVTGIVQKGSKKITGSYLINNISGSFYMRKQI